ncbi:MAG: hypothetical protein EPO65_00625 [Dehalococcoidia bacterium]|nr:MAG: hypothetical protein EPO65_00625 [Dehalococcoidia bacterium]
MPYPKGQKWTEEQKAKLRGRPAWNAGKTRAEDARIPTPWKGKTRDDQTRAKIRNSVQALKGDDVGYGAAHHRVRVALGTPSRCEHCGTTSAARYEWAYTGPGHDSGQKPYSVDPADYVRLCTTCHFKFDGKGTVRRGDE